MTLGFPLLDWGRRYRDAQQARARKRQSRLDEIIRRQEYQQRWFTAEEQLSLGRARLRQREHAEQSAAKRLQARIIKEVRIKEENQEQGNTTARLKLISYEKGGLTLLELARAQQAVQEARMARINAQAAVMQSVLAWMDLTQTLQNQFLEPVPVQEE